MERGLIQGHVVAFTREPLKIQFLIPGSPTPVNPIKAFQQGLHGGGQVDQLYEVEGMRCSACGYLDLYAVTKTT